MRHAQEIASILQQVSPWPREDRVALAYKILRNAHLQARQPAPRQTADAARGIAAGSSPPPDDETARQWINEHRLRKHG